jgi:hypothetical protein
MPIEPVAQTIALGAKVGLSITHESVAGAFLAVLATNGRTLSPALAIMSDEGQLSAHDDSPQSENDLRDDTSDPDLAQADHDQGVDAPLGIPTNTRVAAQQARLGMFPDAPEQLRSPLTTGEREPRVDLPPANTFGTRTLGEIGSVATDTNLVNPAKVTAQDATFVQHVVPTATSQAGQAESQPLLVPEWSRPVGVLPVRVASAVGMLSRPVPERIGWPVTDTGPNGGPKTGPNIASEPGAGPRSLAAGQSLLAPPAADPPSGDRWTGLGRMVGDLADAVPDMSGQKRPPEAMSNTFAPSATELPLLEPDRTEAPLLGDNDQSTRGFETVKSLARGGIAAHALRLDPAVMTILRDSALAVADGGGRLIELDTGSDVLGKLSLSIQSLDGTLQVTLLSGRPEALDILRRALGVFLRDLSAQGFHDVDVHLGPRELMPAGSGAIPAFVKSNPANDPGAAVARFDRRL